MVVNVNLAVVPRQAKLGPVQSPISRSPSPMPLGGSQNPGSPHLPALLLQPPHAVASQEDSVDTAGVPMRMRCPITFEAMFDPVTDGVYNYERHAILHYIETKRQQMLLDAPVVRGRADSRAVAGLFNEKALTEQMLRSNHLLRQEILAHPVAGPEARRAKIDYEVVSALPDRLEQIKNGALRLKRSGDELRVEPPTSRLPTSLNPIAALEMARRLRERKAGLVYPLTWPAACKAMRLIAPYLVFLGLGSLWVGVSFAAAGIVTLTMAGIFLLVAGIVALRNIPTWLIHRRYAAALKALDAFLQARPAAGA